MPLADVAASGRADDRGNPPSRHRATLYCNFGDATNLAVARGRSCLFTRISPVGLEDIAGGLASATGLSHEHAAMWLNHVGLGRPVEEIEGDPRRSPARAGRSSTAPPRLVDELRLSLDFYGAQETAAPVERIVLCGPGSAIPELAAEMEAAVGLPIAVGTPRRPLRLRRRHRGAPDPAPRTRPRRLMRPVNLIPPEERPGGHKPLRSGPLAYIFVGALAAAVIAITALVVTEGNVSDRKTEVAHLKSEEASITAKAQALSAYTAFTAVREQRLATVTSLADSRFDWARVLHELSLVIPADVQLTTLAGSGSPVKSATAVGGHRDARARSPDPRLKWSAAPAVRPAVAGFIEALKDIDGVTRVGVQGRRSAKAADGGNADHRVDLRRTRVGPVPDGRWLRRGAGPAGRRQREVAPETTTAEPPETSTEDLE